MALKSSIRKCSKQLLRNNSHRLAFSSFLALADFGLVFVIFVTPSVFSSEEDSVAGDSVRLL